MLTTNVKRVTKVEPFHVHVDVNALKKDICTLMAAGRPFCSELYRGPFLPQGLVVVYRCLTKSRNIKWK